MALHVIGVRHHSPACARLVEETLRRVKPRFVLIEGPFDINDRIAELHLGHTLPIAVFSYLWQDGRTSASWTPLCDYSPEWVALKVSHELGLDARFMDLPAWHKTFEGVRNRFSDRVDRVGPRIQALCERLSLPDSDSLWDHLFEQPATPAQLAERLHTYFVEIRGDEVGDERDGPREDFMAQCLAWALDETAKTGGDVAVVCGGYHAPALPPLAEKAVQRTWPACPTPADGSRAASYLVPYSFHRLDSFVGYESGMPSPGYHQLVWEQGVDAASEGLMTQSIQRLREKKQPVSPADHIAAHTLSRALQMLRGHAALARVDALDGLAGALVKDALEVPLPWTRRGTILPRTDPALVEVMAAFSGHRIGKLAAGTPHPPLLADVEAELNKNDLVPQRAKRDVKLTLTVPADVQRSRVLHRLLLLQIPGFTRVQGPGWATDAELTEIWRLSREMDYEASLIEASAYGASLEGAAASKLEEALLAAQGIKALTELLGTAAFIGLLQVSDKLLSDLAAAVASEPEVGQLGEGLGQLLALYRHDVLLGSQGARMLADVLRSGFERTLWLWEGLSGPTAHADASQLVAAQVLRELWIHAGRKLGLDLTALLSVMRRRARDMVAPPAIRGASLGLRWALAPEAQSSEEAVAALKASSHPERFGDFLAGLFAAAREEVIHSPQVLDAVDPVLGQMSVPEFLVAAPSLRMAFAYFPPAEKATLAREILKRHKHDPAQARAMVKGGPSPEAALKGMALEHEVDELMKRFGLRAPAGSKP